MAKPMQEEIHNSFKADSGIIVRPGKDNFYDGGPYPEDNPVCEQQMISAVRKYYTCWKAEGVEKALAGTLQGCCSAYM
jgi:hypothetical protein